MKKVLLKVFGMAALMMYNVQLFDTETGVDISLPALEKTAVAQNEGGGGGYGGLCCQTVGPSCSHPNGMVFARARPKA